jgi:hypothetical protein
MKPDHTYNPSMPNLRNMTENERVMETLPLIGGLRPVDVWCAFRMADRTFMESFNAKEQKKSLSAGFMPNAVLNAPYMAPDDLIQEVLDEKHGYVTPSQRIELEKIVALRLADKNVQSNPLR